MSIPYILFFLGIFFFALTSFGLLRMPDAYCRLHAASIGDTLGFGFIVLGLLFLVSGIANCVKLLMVLGIIWTINPTTSHYVGKVALLRGNWVVLTLRGSKEK
ncbi:MAG TPA: cation:proton antiporter [Firmicutes bacterium]|jgi:multicomponent Na+:H+ antiporter subunit G|nr:cation:proton antiporter [Bacillota bacterium]